MHLGLGALILPMIVFLLPETQQYRVYQQIKSSDPAAAAAMAEGEAIDASPPVFHAPWKPLRRDLSLNHHPTSLRA